MSDINTDFEAGVIMVLDGLTKVTLNGVFVEVEQKISTTDGSVRWKCTPLTATDSAESLAVKSINLIPPETPTEMTLDKALDLCTKAQVDFRNARNTGNIKLLDAAKAKLNEALLLVPQCGMAYNSLGDISHFTGQSQETILKYMRRAVANSLKTEYDEKRILQARLGLAGTLGNLGDGEGEMYHLRTAEKSPYLSSVIPNSHNTIQMLIGDSLVQHGKYDEGMDVLLKLQSRGNLGTNMMNQNITKAVKQRLVNVSYHFHQVAEKLEHEGDGLQGAARLSKYTEAKEVYSKALQSCPTDEATKHAYIRIQAKLNPKLSVSTMPSGHVGILNATDNEISLNTTLPVDEVNDGGLVESVGGQDDSDGGDNDDENDDNDHSEDDDEDGGEWEDCDSDEASSEDDEAPMLVHVHV